LQFNIVVVLSAHPLVVVVDRDREDLLGAVLTDDVLAQLFVETLRSRDMRERWLRPASRSLLFFDDLTTELNALVADVDRSGSGDQTPNLLLAFPTK
jgi:hypothetical protein